MEINAQVEKMVKSILGKAITTGKGQEVGYTQHVLGTADGT